MRYCTHDITHKGMCALSCVHTTVSRYNLCLMFSIFFSQIYTQLCHFGVAPMLLSTTSLFDHRLFLTNPNEPVIPYSSSIYSVALVHEPEAREDRGEQTRFSLHLLVTETWAHVEELLWDPLNPSVSCACATVRRCGLNSPDSRVIWLNADDVNVKPLETVQRLCLYTSEG